MQKTVPKQVDDVKMRYHRFWPVAFGVEANGIGLTTFQLLQVAGLPIYDVHADADKYSRSVAISTLYKGGAVFHLAESPYLEEYESELMKFPKGSTTVRWT